MGGVPRGGVPQVHVPHVAAAALAAAPFREGELVAFDYQGREVTGTIARDQRNSCVTVDVDATVGAIITTAEKVRRVGS